MKVITINWDYCSFSVPMTRPLELVPGSDPEVEALRLEVRSSSGKRTG